MSKPGKLTTQDQLDAILAAGPPAAEKLAQGASAIAVVLAWLDAIEAPTVGEFEISEADIAEYTALRKPLLKLQRVALDLRAVLDSASAAKN